MSKNLNCQREIIFMPWANLQNKIKIGPVELLPWEKIKMEMDFSLRQLLDNLLKKYQNSSSSNIDTIAICSLPENIFKGKILEREVYVQRAINGLIFATICPNINQGIINNNNSGVSLSDRFEIITRTICNDEIFFHKPGDNNRWNATNYPLQTRPLHIGNIDDKPDNNLLSAWGDIIEPTKITTPELERLFRSLEWFRHCHTGNWDANWRLKIVAMSTIFEIILNIPKKNSKKDLITSEINKIFDINIYLNETRLIGKVHITKTKPAFFIWDFYNVRNKIVHGDIVTDKEIWYTSAQIDWLDYMIVADVLFQACFEHKMSEINTSYKPSNLNKVYKILGWI